MWSIQMVLKSIAINLAATANAVQTYLDSNGRRQYIYSGTLTGSDVSEGWEKYDYPIDDLFL